MGLHDRRRSRIRSWRRLRDEAPVYYNEQHDFYALSRYDDVLNGLVDTDTFKSGHGIVLEMITPEPYENIEMMIMKDPPAHTRLRKLVARAFTPRAISDLERRVRELCGQFLDTVAGQDEFDYIATFAGLLPPTVILALVGYPDGYAAAVPRPRHQDAARRGGRHPAGHGLDVVDGVEERRDRPGGVRDHPRAHGAAPQGPAGRPAHRARARRDRGGREDPHAHARGDPRLRAAHLAGRHRDRRPACSGSPRSRWRSTPTSARSWSTTRRCSATRSRSCCATRHRRRCSRAGSRATSSCTGSPSRRARAISFLNGAADRDERHFPDPDRFDIHRDIDRQLGFGYGAHFCIGAAVARLEGRVALHETLKRYPTWEIDESRLERIHTSTVRGYTSVPMRVR